MLPHLVGQRLFYNHRSRLTYLESRLRRNFSSSVSLRTSSIGNEGSKAGTDQLASYTETLILPKTKFSIRYSAAKVEATYRDRCSTELYRWQRENNVGPLFILHDGPPYANGKLHMGHALNRVLKDITNRYKVLRGFSVRYIPGWDCHGLPIEMKALAKNKSFQMKPLDIRKVARNCALEAIQDQKSDLQRWGIMADWEDVYRTLDADYTVRQLKVFKEFINKGYAYRQFRPVYWSPSSQTALAESELEYNDKHVSTAAYVKFLVNLDSDSLCPTDLPLYAVIWTTTPWTLPSNQAISVNPDLEYSIYKSSTHGCYFLLASALQNQLSSILGGLEWVKSLKGNDLNNLSYTHPLTNKIHPFIFGAHVTDTSGTGLVHTAPDHGMVDYLACLEPGISPMTLVDNLGRFTPEAGPSLQGKEVLGEGTQTVLELLSDKGALINSSQYVHSYPYDWRTKKPVIQRATSQWFINVSEISHTASEMVKERLHTIPESGLNRLTKFLTSRTEWCISRQRSWGVPIPVLYNEETGEPVLNDEVLDHIIDKIKEHGTDSWWSLPAEEFLPPTYKANGKTNGTKYVKGTDTMDVWFDSGTSWTLIDERFKRDSVIGDVYLEGSDQHRGWFQSSLLTCIGATGKLPYSTLITHGFLLDQNGYKMSKSIGNTVEPSLIVNGGKDLKKHPAYGADGMRFWVASSDYTQDISLGPDVLASTANCVSKVRNTTRFLLANLQDFHESLLVPYHQLLSIDRFILHELDNFHHHMTSSYDAFTYNRVAQELFRFSSTTLSSFYFDITKDRLYLEPASSLTRRSVQTVLYHVLNAYMKVISPIACHMAEEIFDHAKFMFDSPPTSVFQLGWLENNPKWNDPALASKWEIVHQLRKSVNSLISQARDEKILASSSEAAVALKGLPLLPNKLVDAIYELECFPHFELTQALIVSSLSLDKGPPNTDTSSATSPPNLYSKSVCLEYVTSDNASHSCEVLVQVSKSKKSKCPRCWIWSSDGHLCMRCERVLQNL